MAAISSEARSNSSSDSTGVPSKGNSRVISSHERQPPPQLPERPVEDVQPRLVEPRLERQPTHDIGLDVVQHVVVGVVRDSQVRNDLVERPAVRRPVGPARDDLIKRLPDQALLTMMTCMSLGPCAGLTIVCSISAVRDGPETMLTVRGIWPCP